MFTVNKPDVAHMSAVPAQEAEAGGSESQSQSLDVRGVQGQSGLLIPLQNQEFSGVHQGASKAEAVQEGHSPTTAQLSFPSSFLERISYVLKPQSLKRQNHGPEST